MYAIKADKATRDAFITLAADILLLGSVAAKERLVTREALKDWMRLAAKARARLDNLTATALKRVAKPAGKNRSDLATSERILGPVDGPDPWGGKCPTCGK